MQYPFDPISLQAAESFHSRPEHITDESMGVPLVAEYEQIKAFWERLLTVLKNSQKKQSVFVFINEKVDATESVRASNQKTLDFFQMHKNEKTRTTTFGQHHLFIINGTRDEWKLQAKEGVGRARKVLGDLALLFYREKNLRSSVHRQSDADVRLPADYFQAELAPHTVAGTYPFCHSRGILSDKEYAGLLSYENFLRSYVEGLKFAASPYAFWALGSTLIFDLEAYEKIRGFSNVQAGEDFYFLSKMAKLGRIQQIDEAVQNKNLDIKLEIVGRKSDRVPFGTGRALENLENGGSFEGYPKQSFEELSMILCELGELSQHKNVDKFFKSIPAENHFNLAELRNAFEKIFAQNSSPAQHLKQIHQTFDGLQTFRWVREKTAAILHSRKDAQEA